MITRWILLCLMLIVAPVYSADFVKGEGHFYQHDGDSYQFIKDQLIYESTKSIISEELKSLNLNKDHFWQEYDQRLNAEYDRIDNSLKAKYKIGDGASASEVARYKDQLRKSKLSFRRRFLGLNRVLSKFSVTRISRSPRDPKYRVMKLEGAVDRNFLTKTYYNLVAGKKTSDFGKLYLNTHFVMDGLSFTDLEIENEKEFGGEIIKSWIDWFEKNKPMNIVGTEALSDENESRLIEYLKIPAEQILVAAPEEFHNSLLLDIEIKVTKVDYDQYLNTYLFAYEGHAYLKDLHSNMIVNSYTFSQMEKNYRITKGLNLANLIANHVYQMAVGYFPQIQSKIKEITPVSTIHKLKLASYKNMKQVDKFKDNLEQKGIKYSMKVKLDVFSQKKAELLCFYDGTKEDLYNLLKIESSAKNDTPFEVIGSSSDFEVKFRQVTQPL